MSVFVWSIEFELNIFQNITKMNFLYVFSFLPSFPNKPSTSVLESSSNLYLILYDLNF